MSQKEQMSDSYALNVLLTVAGGFLDAYTYTVRGHVFANTQTGNVVQCGFCLIEGDFLGFFRYLLPVLAFAMGIFLVVYVRDVRHIRNMHWRQETVMIEALILLVVAFLPQTQNVAANILVALACAIQVQSFRKVEDYTYSSTMCTGNLRSFAYALAYSLNKKDTYYSRRAAAMGSLLLVFMLGAALGAVFSRMLGVPAVLIPCGLLELSIVAMR